MEEEAFNSARKVEKGFLEEMTFDLRWKILQEKEKRGKGEMVEILQKEGWMTWIKNAFRTWQVFTELQHRVLGLRGQGWRGSGEAK